MTLFGGGCKTLIVEADDGHAARYDRILKRFPDAENIRARSPEEALRILNTDPSIEQVLIDGNAWSVVQAISLLST